MPDDTLMEKIKNSIENLVTLEIVTAVGNVTKKADSDSFEIAEADKTPMVLTQVNLLAGDIKTIFHEDFVTGPYKDLRTFHADREKEAHGLIEKKLRDPPSRLKDQ